jgi:hypothetical protein
MNYIRLSTSPATALPFRFLLTCCIHMAARCNSKSRSVAARTIYRFSNNLHQALSLVRLGVHDAGPVTSGTERATEKQAPCQYARSTEYGSGSGNGKSSEWLRRKGSPLSLWSTYASISPNISAGSEVLLLSRLMWVGNTGIVVGK